MTTINPTEISTDENNSLTSSSSSGPVCRYCLQTEEEIKPNILMYPCQCKTPICKECLDFYVSNYYKTKCEICQSDYVFIDLPEKKLIIEEKESRPLLSEHVQLPINDSEISSSSEDWLFQPNTSPMLTIIRVSIALFSICAVTIIIIGFLHFFHRL